MFHRIPKHIISTTVLSKWFLQSTAIILFVTGTAKLIAALGGAEILDGPDPIFRVHFRHVLFVVGLVEIGVAGLCLKNRLRQVGLFMVAWLATSFLVYRLGLWWIGWSRPCSCLGNLTDSSFVDDLAV